MGERERHNHNHNHNQQQQQRQQHGGGTTSSSSSSRMGLRGGEIVEVQGGHIVRSTGRKDRHSKVCTAKGPRDRRVRLSAHTAIQFYDVQDRLGYDRPSKAVDWLIHKAKAAIDQLAHLPAWDPTATATSAALNPDAAPGDGGVGSGFLPGTLDADIADTIKSLFPVGVTTTAADMGSSSVQFQGFPPDLLSRSRSQDLRLSLQSFQEPILLHQHQDHHQQQQSEDLFSATTSLGLDAASFPEENQHGRMQRMVAWNGGGGGRGSGGEGGGFMFNSPSPVPMPTVLPPLFGHTHYQSQRGPLQSSNTPSIRAWMDQSFFAGAAADNHHSNYYLPPAAFHHQSPFYGAAGLASGGFSGFRIPARIQGEEEHDGGGGVSDKPSSGSSDSRH